MPCPALGTSTANFNMLLWVLSQSWKVLFSNVLVVAAAVVVVFEFLITNFDINILVINALLLEFINKITFKWA